MSFLLGSEYCLQSLSSDVVDLQNSIEDILSKTGKINSISWKFPDKIACDLNISQLLNNYRYNSDDTEQNQVSHIILLELIIDRICLMLQLNCEFIDLNISKASSKPPERSQSGKTISPCLGLTCKKHWNKLYQENCYMANIIKELDKSKKMLDKIQKEQVTSKPATNEACKAEVGMAKDALLWMQQLDNERETAKQSIALPSGTISHGYGCKSSQTLDTAFKPCESCHISQTCVKGISQSLMKSLKFYSYKSQLTKYSSYLNNLDWLDDRKLLELKSALSNDMQYLVSHAQSLHNKCVSLDQLNCANQNQIERTNQQRDELEKKIDNMNKYFEDERAHLERKVERYSTELEEIKEKYKIAEERSTTRIEGLSENTIDLKEKLQINMSKLKEHEVVQLKLLQLIDSNQSDNCTADLPDLIGSKLNQLQHEVNQLSNQLKCQQSVNENLNENEQMIRSKEDKLMRRIQQMVEQKKSMEDKLDQLELQLEMSRTQLDNINKHNSQLTNEIADYQQSISDLTNQQAQTNKQLQELQSTNEKLLSSINQLEKDNNTLVKYPDLNGPLTSTTNHHEQQSIQQQLANQIQSNKLRINLLSQQNQDFNTALQKLQQEMYSIPQHVEAELPEIRDPSVPVRFQQNKPPIYGKKDDSHVPSIDVARPPSTQQSTCRGYSALSRNSHSAKHKQNTVTIPTNHNHSVGLIQWSVATNKSSNGNSSANIHTCETCGRQYPQKTDLQIHKEYCAGRKRR